VSGYGGQYDHRAPVERLINATPERFDLAALLEAFRPAWMNDAPCFGHDADFFPSPGDRATAAKALCASCPVQPTCLDYALTNGIGHGVWGGLNEAERARHPGAVKVRARIDHGTKAGYSAHVKRGERPCVDCREAKRRSSASERARRMAVAS
jgi:WhiB family redox-sensing transcriptional regulator